MFDVLDRMSANGGILCTWNFFIPFEDGEFQQFFDLCDRAEVVKREMRRCERLKPCPQVLSWADRAADTRHLERIQEAGWNLVKSLCSDIEAFQKKVLDRFKASR